MKSILEQNFDELYAQVEVRVKCIKPVIQIDTYAKTLTWTTLNEIVSDVFGESRFMWMINDIGVSFCVEFVDRYRSVSVRQLLVQYVEEFKLPTEDELLNMSYDELREFEQSCRDRGITLAEICKRYNKCHTWLYSVIKLRKGGAVRKDSDDYRFKISKSRSSSWTDDELNNHLFVYELSKRKIPISANILGRMFGDMKTANRVVASVNSGSNVCRSWLTHRDERYLITLDKMIQYLELAIIAINTNHHVLRSQTIIKLSATTSEEKQKELTSIFKNMKYAMEIEKRNRTNTNLNTILNAKEATNDRVDK